MPPSRSGPAVPRPLGHHRQSVRQHRGQFGALGLRPGLPEPASRGHWTKGRTLELPPRSLQLPLQDLVLKTDHTSPGAVCQSRGPYPRGEPRYPRCICEARVSVGAGDVRGTQGHRPVLPLFPRSCELQAVASLLPPVPLPAVVWKDEGLQSLRGMCPWALPRWLTPLTPASYWRKPSIPSSGHKTCSSPAAPKRHSSLWDQWGVGGR